MDALPQSNEAHTVPSGYWKIITLKEPGGLSVAAFIMGQNVAQNAEPANLLVSVDDVEQRSGLDFFWELSQSDQQQLEGVVNGMWFFQ